MNTGFLKVAVHTGDDAIPVPNAKIIVSDPSGKIRYQAKTDAGGMAGNFVLAAPNKSLTLDPENRKPAYSTYNIDITADGYVTKHISNVPIVDTQTCILQENMQPLTDENIVTTDEYLDLAPLALLLPVENRQADIPPLQPEGIAEAADPLPFMPVDDVRPDGSDDADSRIITGGARIPDYITVHLGIPTNASARNLRIRFSDYVKNVTSGEIYSTWPQSSLEANIHAIVTFVLNRVYTEWYRSRGYNFDITNSTSYDMNYRDGGPVFENISRLVDQIFNVYARRIGFENPYFTEFCNGSTVSCPGMSQWGTVTLANQGRSPLEILRFYYPKDLELITSNNIGGVTESYPGSALSIGSQGAPVKRIQDQLNRIRVNYPLITQISNPNGTFGQDTADAVRVFQRTFNMTADGIVGRATWNKINFIFLAVTKLAELNGEGIRVSIGEAPPNVVLSAGARGNHVLELQFILNYLSLFYPSIPTVIQDGVFESRTKNSVIEFQKAFELTPDGIVGPATWNKLYAAYRGTEENVPMPPAPTPTPPAPGRPQFPGTSLRLGSTGANVRLMQSFLNVINAVYPTVPKLTADGIFGQQTEGAVKAFQQAAFLTPDGIIGPITWDKIVDAYLRASGQEGVDLTYPGTPLRAGSRGNTVRLMQTFLSDIRASYPSLPLITVDGIFGPNTEAAVIGFQRLFGLVPDGVIGPATWYAIIEQRNNR